MAYIGREPQVGNFQVCDAISVVNNQAAYTMQVSSVNVIPETAQNMIVSLNGVIQKPNSSYTVAGAVITFSSALVTGDVINFIQILGSVLDLGTPSDDTVTLSKMAPGTDGNIISYDTSGNPVAVATGSSGQVLTSAGAGAIPTFATIETGISWQSSIVTASTITVVAGRGYWINTTSNACTITLPSSASVGDQLIFTDYLRTWGTNAVTINQNSLKFQGQTSPNPVYNTAGQSVDIVYSGATNGWIPNSDDDVTNEVPQAYSSNFLVVAGGGGSGNAQLESNTKYATGGGGGGGFRTSTQGLSPGSQYTVTVGAGGAVTANGSNSSFSGTGITTITSAGGGTGGNSGASAPGGNGGSGGGAGDGGSVGAGNTPSTSPSQGNNGGAMNGSGNTAAGGGGGASAVGGNASLNTGGNGGAGTANSITGSSVTLSGGGGGGSGYAPSNGAAGGSAGAGGGGAGSNSQDGAAGTVNTGGGGGGGKGGYGTGTAGGSGVVVLSVATSNYSGTTSGSPTVTTSSGNTIMKFTGSGSYTA